MSTTLVNEKRKRAFTVILNSIVSILKADRLEILAIHSLQGALGKTAGRSYKAAPRQLLQVDSNGAVDGPANAHAHGHISKDDAKENAAGAAKEAARRGREALGDVSPFIGPFKKCVF